MTRFLFAALGVVVFSASLASAQVVGRAINTSGADLFTSFSQPDPDYDLPGDMFGIRNRNNPDPPGSVNFPGLPFSIADDSLVNFPGDQFGIIKDQDFDDFFGVADTVNSTGNDVNEATWTFDISTATSGVMVSIDMAAMGDFEDSDVFDFEYQIDGGGFNPLFTSLFVDTDDATNGDGQSYTMEDGMTYIVDDPMEVNGVRLINDFQTLMATIAGTGNALDLKFIAETNGSPEAFAFRNILIEASTGMAFDEGDFDQDGDVDGDDFLAWQSGFGTPSGATKGDGDYDNDGDVDGDDFLGWQSEFGNGGGSGAVPEPTAIALLAMLGLGAAAMRFRNG